MPDAPDRKLLGAWYTPDELVRRVVKAAVTSEYVHSCLQSSPVVAVVDPACGDGRFLVAAAQQIARLGGRAHVVGVDIDEAAVVAARIALAEAAESSNLSFKIVRGDALQLDWSTLAAPHGTFDLVVGNPPFLSQLASTTTRGGSSPRGGGPYADAAVEFVALAAEIVAPAGRVAFVLPQSLLSARDAGATRAVVDARADMVWSWWTGDHEFDAHVHTCAVVFQFGQPRQRPGATWGHVVTDRSGVPGVPDLGTNQAGVLGDRCWLNANFRDEYYGMIPAVADHDDGPKLITSGLIDPGRLWWGSRSITFAKQRFAAPRLDTSVLDVKMQRWAERRLIPKVLIANQTKIVEAVADPVGDLLPGVPVVCAYPTGDGASQTAWEIAAVLTSPLVSAWAWHHSAGTGLSADAIRIGPVLLADVPWPKASLDAAVDALRSGDVRACGREVHEAFGLDGADSLFDWWEALLCKIEARQPPDVTAGPRP